MFCQDFFFNWEVKEHNPPNVDGKDPGEKENGPPQAEDQDVSSRNAFEGFYRLFLSGPLKFTPDCSSDGCRRKKLPKPGQACENEPDLHEEG
jgi:hypothetical protein